MSNPPLFFFFFNDTATTEIYTLSLHDALPIYSRLPSVPRGEGRTVRSKSLDHRDHVYAGHLYGVARHRHCQCFLAAYRRRSRRQLRRKHLGPDQLSGVECRGSSAFRMAEPGFWTQTLLYALRRALYFELSALWTCAFLGLAHSLSRSAGCRGRRIGSRGAGYPRGHFPSSEAARSVCAVQHGHCHGSGNRPATRRVDYRLLELALDLIYHQ